MRHFINAVTSFALIVAWIMLAPLTVHNTHAAGNVPDYVVEQYGKPPTVPDGALTTDLEAAVNTAFVESVQQSSWGQKQEQALEVIAQSGDPRLVWIISDLMRFSSGQGLTNALSGAAATLLGKALDEGGHWGVVTDHLIAWDIPAPPGYLDVKREIFTNMVPGWEKIFVEGDIDWRLVSWGGVLIDDRAHDQTDENCNCIPAADNPETSTAEQATWLKDDDIVFGIEVNGE